MTSYFYETYSSIVYRKVFYPPNPAPSFIPQPSYGIGGKHLHTVGNIKQNMIYLWMKNKDAFWMIPMEFNYYYTRGYIWDGSAWNYRHVNNAAVERYY